VNRREAGVAAAVLQGALVSQELPLPPPPCSRGPLQNVAELWQALGGRARRNPRVAAAEPSYTITNQKHGRWWEVREPDGKLVCLTVYRKGAHEVVRRLAS
jgi:hypothetical protein